MSRKKSTFEYPKLMKKLLLTAALLLSAVSATNSFQKLSDPIPECPPACPGGGNVIVQVG